MIVTCINCSDKIHVSRALSMEKMRYSLSCHTGYRTVVVVVISVMMWSNIDQVFFPLLPRICLFSHFVCSFYFLDTGPKVVYHATYTKDTTYLPLFSELVQIEIYCWVKININGTLWTCNPRNWLIISLLPPPPPPLFSCPRNLF